LLNNNYLIYDILDYKNYKFYLRSIFMNCILFKMRKEVVYTLKVVAIDERSSTIFFETC